MFAIEARDFARRFAIDGALLQIRALIARDFALGHAKLGFELAVFPIEFENDQRTACHLCFAVELVDLLAVQQKFAHTFGSRNFVTRLCVRLDISVIEKGFAIFNSRKSVADICLASADGLNLAALQLDASLVAIENVIVAQRLAIDDRLSRHIAQSPRGDQACVGRLSAVRRLVKQLVS
jgi:hypothetical protein